MAQTTEVLDLLLTARYVGGPAFGALGRDIDTLVNSTSGLAKVGAAFSMVGMFATAAGVAVASFAVEAIKQYDGYNAAVNRLIAVHALASDQVSQFNQIVMQTSDQFGQNSTDIAQGLYVMMSGMQALGYTANDVFKNNIIQSLGAFVSASGNGQPGSVSWQNAAQDVLHIASAFSLPMSQWPTMMGQMTAVENASGITQNNLVQAVLRASSTANEIGLNPAELFATFGAMGTAGVFGPRAGTELASGLRLMLSNKTSLSALKSIGISPNSFFDKTGNLLDPGVILSSIFSHVSTLSPQKRFATESAIFGAVGNRALGQIMNPQVLATYNNLMNREVQNPVAGMFGIAGQQLNNFNGAVMRLHQAVLNFMKTVGGPLANALMPLINNLSTLINKLTGFLATGAGQNLMSHLPGLVFGSAAGLLTAGPAMQLGGGWLRDFALAQDTKHVKSAEELKNFLSSTGMQRNQLVASQALQRQGLLDRIALAMTGKGSVAGRTAAQQTADLLRPRSAYWNTLAQQRIDALMPYVGRTKTGLISRKGADPLFQQLFSDAIGAKGPSAGLAQRRVWDYVNANWGSLSGSYGLGPNAGPDEKALLKSMVKQRTATGPNKTAQRLQQQLGQFDQRSALQLNQFDERVAANKPEVEKTAGQVLSGHFAHIGKAIWGFGNTFSPYRLGKAGLDFLGKQTNAAYGRFATAFTTHMAGKGTGINTLDSLLGIGKGIGGVFQPITDKITGAAKGVLHFGVTHLPKAAHGFAAPMREALGLGEKAFGGPMNIGQRIGTMLKATPKSLFQGVIGGFKDMGGGILNVAKLLPGLVTGFLSFGSALLPIIAVVLLVAGVITIGVLAFTKYRTQVMEVVKVFQTAFAPVFAFVRGVVLSVLKDIQTAWKAHSKEINAAMQQLFAAIKQAAPFFQQIGFVIGAIIAVIVKVIGYLVTAFIAALPYIIGVFTSIFKFLGDLGNIINAVIHGKWGVAWTYAKQALMDAWGVIKNVIMMLWTFLASIFTNLWKDISGPLTGLWNNITTWFSNLGKSIQTALINALHGLGNALHNAISNPVQSAINSIPGLGTAISAGQSLWHWMGHAEGGYIANSQLSWVGERGPELVRLPGGSQVYKHSDSMAMTHALSTGGTIHQLQLHIAKLELGQHNGEDEKSRSERRSPAEEYFFSRQIQREREDIWARYPNTSREFDHTYRKAYQYYG